MSNSAPLARFTTTFLLLEQEAHLARSCLCTGLTALRKANLHEKGLYYTAFFQLSIGIERLAKLAIILDHMEKNRLRAPGKAMMKSHGHDLDNLFSTVAQLSCAGSVNPAAPFALSPLAKRILCFLSDFANGSRYASLDSLGSGNAGMNPLEQWSQILSIAISTKVGLKTQQSNVKRAVALSEAMEGSTIIIAHDLADKPLTLAESISQTAYVDNASPHLILEIMSILSPLRDFITRAGDAARGISYDRFGGAMNIPYMSEFFEFIVTDRNHVLRKKRWP